MPSSDGILDSDTVKSNSYPPPTPPQSLALHPLPNGDGVSARSLQSLFQEQQG